jgi:DNA polymerase III delta subunit
MSNIYLFTGEEPYLVDQELQRRREGFVQKFGSDTVFVYDPENFDPTAIMENCLGG